MQRPDTELTFAACSGAQTSNVLSTQVSSVTATTAIVTITIGGNDAGFSDVIVECAKPSWASNCAGRVTTAQNFINNTLPGRLNSVYSAIDSRAPSATVVVLGYPRVFMGEDCNAGTFFSGDDMTRLNATADILRNVTRTRAQAYGFTFKDAIPPFTGHAVCSSTEWLNGSRTGGRELPPEPHWAQCRLRAAREVGDRLARTQGRSRPRVRWDPGARTHAPARHRQHARASAGPGWRISLSATAARRP